MGTADVGAAVQWLRADNRKNDGFAVSVAIDLVAGLEFHAGFQRLKTMLFRFGNRPVDGFTLGFAGADKAHVFLAVWLDGGQIGIGNHIVAIFGGKEQLFPHRFIFFFFHRS